VRSVSTRNSTAVVPCVHEQRIRDIPHVDREQDALLLETPTPLESDTRTQDRCTQLVSHTGHADTVATESALLCVWYGKKSRRIRHSSPSAYLWLREGTLHPYEKTALLQCEEHSSRPPRL